MVLVLPLRWLQTVIYNPHTLTRFLYTLVLTWLQHIHCTWDTKWYTDVCLFVDLTGSRQHVRILSVLPGCCRPALSPLCQSWGFKLQLLSIGIQSALHQDVANDFNLKTPARLFLSVILMWLFELVLILFQPSLACSHRRPVTLSDLCVWSRGLRLYL